jgi:hypothetical protein
MATGSMAVLPVLPKEFLDDASSMKIIDANTSNQWSLGNEKEYIIYSDGGPVTLDLSESAKYEVCWIDPKNGVVMKKENVKGSKAIKFNADQHGAFVLWAHVTDGSVAKTIRQ